MTDPRQPAPTDGHPAEAPVDEPLQSQGRPRGPHDRAREGWLVEERADALLPEESSVGSADPQAQAAAVLAESEERTTVPEGDPDTNIEHRESGV